MKKSFLLLAALTLSFQTARATTVIPPTFDELVAQAQVIFQGKVTDVRSQWVGEGGQRHIVTYVTFQVADAVKGTSDQSYTIRMFGGTVGEESMGVADAPEFQVGDEDILFVENNGSQLIPLVGIMHGRYRVERDNSGTEVVTDHERAPVRNVARLGRTSAMAAPAVERNLTPADFKAAVRTKLHAEQ
jgi:hypothetical protein